MDDGSPRIHVGASNTKGESIQHTNGTGKDEADVAKVARW